MSVQLNRVKRLVRARLRARAGDGNSCKFVAHQINVTQSMSAEVQVSSCTANPWQRPALNAIAIYVSLYTYIPLYTLYIPSYALYIHLYIHPIYLYSMYQYTYLDMHIRHAYGIYISENQNQEQLGAHFVLCGHHRVYLIMSV